MLRHPQIRLYIEDPARGVCNGYFGTGPSASQQRLRSMFPNSTEETASRSSSSFGLLALRIAFAKGSDAAFWTAEGLMRCRLDKRRPVPGTSFDREPCLDSGSYIEVERLRLSVGKNRQLQSIPP